MQHLCRIGDKSRNYNEAQTEVWPGVVIIMTLACDSRDREFNSRPLRCQVGQPRASYSHTCASVTKQYNLAPVAVQRCSATGKVTVGLASHGQWSCVTDLSGLSINGLREMGTPPTLRKGYGTHYLYKPR